MSEFNLHKFSSRQYLSNEIISFSKNPLTHFADIDKEMQYHRGVSHVQISNLTQEEFDNFILNYADNYKSLYFFQNTEIRDLTALSTLENVEYILFYNLRKAESLWDMSGNKSLKGIMISETKKLIYDLSLLSTAPALEELMLFSNLNRKYTIKSAKPLTECKKLKRAMFEFNTEAKDFNPNDFSNLEIFKYQVDKKRNFTY